MKQRVNSYIPFIVTAMTVLLLSAASEMTFAQPTVSVGKSVMGRDLKENGVMAHVYKGSGLVHIQMYPGLPTSPFLTFPQKSFVTFSIGSGSTAKHYTNNDVGYALPSNFAPLTDGIVTKIADTIRCVWPNKDGLDLIQEVYPVVLTYSAQIIIRWKVYNNTNTPVPVTVQYLHDILIDGNDQAPVLTRFGYTPLWNTYTNGGLPGMPWFYAAFKNALPNPPTFNPGTTGLGFTDDTYYNFGLQPPNRMTVGDWTKMVIVPLGPPSPLPSGQYNDCAVLFQFNSGFAAPKKESFLANMSWGTAEFLVCKGEIFGILFYPPRIKWIPPNLVPNPFNVDFYAFNPDKNKGAPNTKLTMVVGDYLTIESPDTARRADKKVQTQTVETGNQAGYIAPLGVGIATWKVRAEEVTDCTNDLYSTLNFIAQSPAFGYPIFTNEQTGSDTCTHPIIIECANQDLRPPIVENEQKPDSFTVKYDIRDNRPITDRGLDKIEWTPKTGTDASKFSISYTPPITQCDKIKHTLTVTQLDSTVGGCFDFTFTDCAKNDTMITICFRAHPIPDIPDTLKPQFTNVERLHKFDAGSPDCNYQFDSILVTDNRLHDRGLLSVGVQGTPVNMQMRSLNIPPPGGISSHLFSVNVIDSMLDGTITIRATDVSGNYKDTTITYCTLPDTIKPLVEVIQVQKSLWEVTVYETRPWDRRIDTIAVVNRVNIMFPNGEPNRSNFYDRDFFKFRVGVIDTTQVASFCVDAVDLAANVSQRICVTQGIDSDKFVPNIIPTPALNTNPTSITVNINDIHLYATGDTIPWDKGIDSVWFTNAIGINKPAPMSFKCVKTVPPFVLSVLDTLDVDSTACITIWARDCALNVSSLQWCYPYRPDDSPPRIVGSYLSRQQLKFTVRDDELYDRGNAMIDLIGEVNLTPPLNINANRAAVYDNIIFDRALNRSSVGTLQTTDYWGNRRPGDAPMHTASITFGVWVQDMQMLKGMLVRQDGQFVMPIFLAATDTFALVRKGIHEIEFTFTLRGDVGALTFDGIGTTGTLTDGWTVNVTPNGNTYRVVVTKPAALPDLSEQTGSKAPVLFLAFTAKKDEATRDITIDIDRVNNESIIYNGGQDNMLTGQNATAIMPAPYGSLSGGRIIILGTCAPALNADNPNPTIVTLEQNRPNPFNSVTNLRYTVKEDGFVRITVFDMLGQMQQVLFEGELKRGTYDLKFDGTPFPGGTYIVRLDANGVVKTRTITLEK
jgi:hypothetical protein